jgi:hypothetical protein
MSEELPGMLALVLAVDAQTWPHTLDARIWADEWLKTIKEHPEIPLDRAAMISWFANAIMAGWDTATLRMKK